jgi:hypothetical protein
MESVQYLQSHRLEKLLSVKNRGFYSGIIGCGCGCGGKRLACSLNLARSYENRMRLRHSTHGAFK